MTQVLLLLNMPEKLRNAFHDALSATFPQVTFHLAENKKNSDRPFAFMVTYASKLSDIGRVNWARACCNEGHNSPEDAAAHGALIAAQALAAYARSLRPPAIGALILAGKSAA